MQAGYFVASYRDTLHEVVKSTHICQQKTMQMYFQMLKARDTFFVGKQSVAQLSSIQQLI